MKVWTLILCTIGTLAIGAGSVLLTQYFMTQNLTYRGQLTGNYPPEQLKELAKIERRIASYKKYQDLGLYTTSLDTIRYDENKVVFDALQDLDLTEQDYTFPSIMPDYVYGATYEATYYQNNPDDFAEGIAIYLDERLLISAFTGSISTQHLATLGLTGKDYRCVYSLSESQVEIVQRAIANLG